MAFRLSFSLSVLVLSLFCLLARNEAVKPTPYSMPFNRSLFPAGFIIGAGSAAYQSEGAAYIDGKGPSTWDIFTKKYPEKIWDQSNGDVADDFYHRYKDDIRLMKKIGLDSFRFSISWTRVVPKGKISGGVNPLGVQFYNNLINELLANGIIPFVTLLHYDPPQALEDAYGGPLSPKFADDFRDYADFCFKTFGDRVKHWITVNEPNGLAINGYNFGIFAPGRCSNYAGNCTVGNSATEPYIVTHNVLLAHAAAVNLYRKKYKPYQKGIIGITIVCHWFVPKYNNSASQLAAYRAIDFMFGWYAHPITYGDYPESMKVRVGNRLPKFTAAQSQALKGSMDYLGLNYYTANYAQDALPANGVNVSYSTDQDLTASTVRNGVPIGTPTQLDWLYIYPRGIREILLYIKKNYQDPIIYITENGLAYKRNDTEPLLTNLRDGLRIRFHHQHLFYLLEAIKEGVKVKAYYAWSFMDDFEWNAGHTVGFGLTYVDFSNNLARHLRYSAYWFKMFLLN